MDECLVPAGDWCVSLTVHSGECFKWSFNEKYVDQTFVFVCCSSALLLSRRRAWWAWRCPRIHTRWTQHTQVQRFTLRILTAGILEITFITISVSTHWSCHFVLPPHNVSCCSLSVWGSCTQRSWRLCRRCPQTQPTGSTQSSWSTRGSTTSKRWASESSQLHRASHLDDCWNSELTAAAAIALTGGKQRLHDKNHQNQDVTHLRLFSENTNFNQCLKWTVSDLLMYKYEHTTTDLAALFRISWSCPQRSRPLTSSAVNLFYHFI